MIASHSEKRRCKLYMRLTLGGFDGMIIMAPSAEQLFCVNIALCIYITV
jgi:hypothetical protein